MTYLRLARTVALFVLIFCIARSASAQVRWNAHNGSWIVPSNWDTSTVPTDADDVLIGGTDGVPRTITYDYSSPDVSLNSLTLDLNGSTSSATNTLFMPSAYNLSTYAETVGYTGNGTINNAAASNSVNTLTLGNYFGSSGAYVLGNQATLSSQNEYIGYGGSGTFTQNGGTHSAFVNIDIAESAGSRGVYNLNAGTLSANTENIGFNGNGTFNHSVGANSLTTMNIGANASSTGVYNLSGAASAIYTSYLNVGYFGSGVFNQTAGTVNADGALYGLTIGQFAYGEYNLGGTGQLTTTYGELVGAGLSGVFNQTGGINTPNVLVIAPSNATGAYNLSGGSVYAQAVFVGGELFVPGGKGTFSVSGTGSLNVFGTMEVFNTPGTGITLSGGSITVDTLQLDGGSSQLNWTGGALNITGANALVIGPTGTLGNTNLTAGKSLSVTHGAIVDTSATLTVDGGSFSGSLNNTGTLNINSGSVILGFSTNTGEINLGGSQAIIYGLPNVGILSSTGLLHGEGTLQLPFSNSGEIRAENGKRLLFAAPCGTNFGQITLQGGTAEFSQALTNGTNGQILGRGILKVGAAGLTNQGNISLSAGITDVYGLVNNNTSSASRGISITSNANVTFWNDVANTSGFFKVNPGSSATFFGAFSGNGITGAGNVDFESDINPGFSPATTTFGGNVNFGAAARLNIELGGANPGQFDQVYVNGQFALDGTLNISLINGFHPQVGQSFDIINWGSRTGEFSSLQTPLGDHIVWDSSQLYTVGRLTVFATYYAGDFNRDGHVDAADILAGQNALADLTSFESQYGLTPANASLIDDLNGDGIFNGADVQYLLTELKNGGGSANPVPEPSTLVLLTAGSLLGLVALRRNRR